MKKIFVIIISVVSVVALIIQVSTWKVKKSIRCLDAIEQNPEPPSPDYYNAYK